MHNEDDRFEQYLRQFRPRKPGPLPETPERPRLRARLLWAAALLAVVCGLSVWIAVERVSRPEIREPQSDPCEFGTAVKPAARDLTLGKLSIYAGRDPACLGFVLSESSRNVLPDVEDSRGALGALAAD